MESEENFRFITENVNDVIIILNKDLKVEYVNELPLNKIAGYHSDDLIDKNGMDYIHPDDLAKALNEFTKSLKMGEASIELRLRHKDGHYVWTEAKGNMIIDHEGTLKAHIIVREISQRKIAEEKLKKSDERLQIINLEFEEQVEKRNAKLTESEEKYRQLFENSPNMIVLIDSNGMIIDVTNTFLTKLGDKKDDLIGKDFRNIEGFAIRNLSLFKEKFNKMLIQGNIEPFEIQTYDKDNKLKWVNIQVSWINIGSKKLLQVIIQDIDERKLTEKQLKESEEKYRLITENANDLMVIVNENLEFEWMNEIVHKKLRGFSSKDIIGKPALNFIHPDDLDDAIKTFKKGFEVGEGMGVVRMQNKMGIFDWLEIRGKKFTDKDGKEKALLISRNITERILAEQKLKESEQKFRIMAENSIVGITLIQDNKIKYVNKKNADMIGYSVNDLLQWDYSNMLKNIYPEDIPLVMEAIQETLQNSERTSYKLEIRVFTKTGQIIWIENFYAQIKYDGKPAQLITSVDITERKLTDNSLKESEERYRSLFENMSTGFAYHKVITDENNKPIDYKYLEVNPAFEKLTGLKADDMIGKNVTEILPGTENDPADWIGRFGKVGLTGVPLTVEDYSAALDRWFKVSGYSPKKGYFAVTFTDITERKKAEQNLRESEEKYRNLVKLSPNSIILTSLDGTIIEYNKITEKYLVLSKDQLIGKKILDLPIIPAEHKFPFQKRWTRMVKNRVIESNEFEYVNKNGEIIWLKNFFSFVRIGGKDYVQIVSGDITKRKKAENVIKKEIKKLKELDQLRKDLITRVSHELKTPLVSIFSCSELLIDYYKEQMSEEVVKFVEIIHRGGQRLKDLIKNLLDASQIDAGKLKLHYEKANLIEIIRNCIDYVKFLVNDRKISLDYEFPEELFIEVDTIRIEQVFTNLLSNALKNTPSNGNICLNITEEDNNIYVTIKDTGVGFTKKEMDKIFKKFGKIERYGKELDVDIEGSGLGLYISKEIVNLHEGMIWVESEGRNKGATFTIKLPTRK